MTISTPPKKSTKLNSLTKLNPAWKEWKERQDGNPATSYPEALPVVFNMKDSREQKIEKLEAELSEINVLLHGVMEKTMLMLSRRQVEMDKWNKLATLRWEDFPNDNDISGDTKAENDPKDDSKEASRCGPLDDGFNLFYSMDRSLIQDCPSADATAGVPSTSSSCRIDESILSSSTAKKLHHMRHQEDRVRGLLWGMKETMNQTSEAADLEPAAYSSKNSALPP